MISANTLKQVGILVVVGAVAFAAGAIAQPSFPHLDRAEHLLFDAKDNLAHAAHDYGGHRVAAIRAVDHALSEIHQAKEWFEHHH